MYPHNRFGETLRLLELIEPACPDVEHREVHKARNRDLAPQAFAPGGT
jgi:hypothetical protein